MTRAHRMMRLILLTSGLLAASGRGMTASEPVLFTRGLTVEVKPDDAAGGVPVNRIELLACPGEFEPFSLAVRGGADGRWTVTASALDGPDPTSRIPSSAVEVSLVRVEQAPGYLGGSARVTDAILHPGISDVVLVKDRTTWLWLTVRVPEDAKAGRYEGALTLTGAGAAQVRVPVVVEVLPVKLQDVPGVQFCLLFTAAFGQYHDARSRAERRPAALAFYRELKDHGMTCIAPKCSDWPYKPGRFEGLEACVQAAREVGLDGPVVWYMSSLINGAKGGRQYASYDGKCDNWNETRDLANLHQIVQDVQKLRQQRGWPEIIFLTVDEPGTQTDDLRLRSLRLKNILPKTLKAAADLGVRTASTISEPVDDKHNRQWVDEPDELRKAWDLSRPYCHVRIYAYGYPQGKTNLDFEQADCRKRGHEMWFYHNPAIMGRDRHCARMYFGLWGWRVGAQGLTAWTYPGGRSVQFELVREGIDDFNYLATLQRLIDRKQGEERDRQEAEAFLGRMKAAIRLDANGCVADWAGAAREVSRLVQPAPGSQEADLVAVKRHLGGLIRTLAKQAG